LSEQLSGYEHFGDPNHPRGHHHIVCGRCVERKLEAKGWRTDPRWLGFMKRIGGQIKLAKARRNFFSNGMLAMKGCKC